MLSTPDRVILLVAMEIMRTPVPSDPFTCCEWLGNRDAYGYGRIDTGKGGIFKIHRVALEIKLGRPIEKMLLARHAVCGNPPCFRLEHLSEGTYQDNSDDRERMGRTSREDRHGSRLHPETRSRGDMHFKRLHPELVPRGEQAGRVKTNSVAVLDIRIMYAKRLVTQSMLAQKHGLSLTGIRKILSGENWSHVGGPRYGRTS